MIYESVTNLKYSHILGIYNNWIIMNFINDGTDNIEYEHINLSIINGIISNISLLIYKGKFSSIDAKE